MFNQNPRLTFFHDVIKEITEITRIGQQKFLLLKIATIIIKGVCKSIQIDYTRNTEHNVVRNIKFNIKRNAMCNTMRGTLF